MISFSSIIASPFTVLDGLLPNRSRLKERLRAEWGERDGERAEHQVFLYLDRHLGSEWEIFHNPMIGQGRPDFVLANRRKGVMIVEVKSWHLDEAYIDSIPKGVPNICIQGEFIRKESPYEQLERYRKDLKNRCSGMMGGGNLEIKTALFFMFPKNRSQQIRRLTSKLDEYSLEHSSTPPQVISIDQIKNSRNQFLLTLPKQRKEMGAKMWGLINSLGLVELNDIPGFGFTLSRQQNEYIHSRTKSGLRRIRGPAGSGKSLVISHRAVKLASEGLQVLVICFNITLLNLLHYMSLRATRKMSGTRVEHLRNISFRHFHEWAKEVAMATTNSEAYDVWNEYPNGQFSVDPQKYGVLISKWIKEQQAVGDFYLMYDAILVDEGQDFCLEWWDALRLTLKNNGEMMLVADTNQDLYGRAENWTEKKMLGSGFSGRWVQLDTSFRFHRQMYPLLESYCNTFLRGMMIPQMSEQTSLLDSNSDSLNVKWTSVLTERNIADGVISLLSELQSNGISGGIEETVLLVDTIDLGKEIVGRIEQELDQPIVHTFAGRSSKLVFMHYKGVLKATTYHSFKGWESSSLIICAGSGKRRKKMRAFYTALTRLRPAINGSMIQIFSADRRLNKWAAENFRILGEGTQQNSG